MEGRKKINYFCIKYLFFSIYAEFLKGRIFLVVILSEVSYNTVQNTNEVTGFEKERTL